MTAPSRSRLAVLHPASCLLPPASCLLLPAAFPSCRPPSLQPGPRPSGAASRSRLPVLQPASCLLLHAAFPSCRPPSLQPAASACRPCAAAAAAQVRARPCARAGAHRPALFWPARQGTAARGPGWAARNARADSEAIRCDSMLKDGTRAAASSPGGPGGRRRRANFEPRVQVATALKWPDSDSDRDRSTVVPWPGLTRTGPLAAQCPIAPAVTVAFCRHGLGSGQPGPLDHDGRMLTTNLKVPGQGPVPLARRAVASCHRD